jgi:hypothetical protein
MSADCRSDAQAPRHARSRVTNGSAILPGVDGRSQWARRLRDLIALHVADLGGIDNVSEAEKAILRRAATLATECERMEVMFALAGEAKPDVLDSYIRAANSMRRMLEALGLKRVPRDVTPSLHDYIAANHAEAAGAD